MKNEGKNDMAADADNAKIERVAEGKARSARGIVPPKMVSVKPVANLDRGGFFTIYKKGQGYWTRMGTVIAATLIAMLMAQFIYTHRTVWFTTETIDKGVKTARASLPLTFGVIAAFLAVFIGIIYYFVNKPTVVDFLIATDSEMKKVNWTTKAELIGSTKVVIIFMLLVAVLLFGLDTFFGELFYLLRILQFGPFG